ncbi:hypothetical protein QYM36_004332 [Artemia franciscana]|uniref:Uncharacterized protein n=1 Tax=Artemia franciscana TaxID=6661 RepID=A0AA88I030_ARTSF|nr:hypothetical protein QYM36_004332 [Artemia franciscana]
MQTFLNIMEEYSDMKELELDKKKTFGDEELELHIAADDETKATIESSDEMAMEDEFEGIGKRSMDLAESAIIEAASEEDDDDNDLTVRNPFPEAFLENSKDNEELKNVKG